jgi:threonine dehydratase
MTTSKTSISIADIRTAYDRIKDHVVRTPLLESDRLNDILGRRALIKAECLQRTGSFKLRGAFNRALQLSAEQRLAGIVAWSSGNHALALAAVCNRLSIPTVIVMPDNAPKSKVAGVRYYGAEIRFYDRQTDDREAIGQEIAATRGAIIVPPYDDISIIAGQGTIGLEIIQQLDEMQTHADAVIVPCSGGGLVAGTAIAIKNAKPGIAMYAAEPEQFDELARSLKSGKPESNAATSVSICDALQVMRPGNLTFPINLALLEGGLSATDEDVLKAISIAYTHLKLVVEPGGAVALAALLSQKMNVSGKTIVIVASGGNVDPTLFAEAIRSY